MAQKNWLKQFEEWMFNRGVFVQKRPSRPMTKATVTNRLKPVRVIMRKLGYLGPKSKPLRNMKVQEIIDYFEKEFPDMGASRPNVYNMHTEGMRKLAEFIQWEVRGRHDEIVFTKEDVERLKWATPKCPTEVVRDFTMTEEFMDRLLNRFLPYLQEQEPNIYAIIAWMFYTECRFIEASNVHVDLDSLDKGTAMRCDPMGVPDPNGDHLKVDRKRKSGKRIVQKICPDPKLWEILDWWMERRNPTNGIETLFHSKRGRTWCANASSLNRSLRLAGKKSGIFTGDCQDNGSRATGELVLLTSHTLGRKAAITFDIHSGSSDTDAMKRSGHTDPKVFHTHYPKVDAASATERNVALHEKYWAKRNGKGTDQVDIDKRSIAKELLADQDMRAALSKELLADPELRKAMIQELKEELIAALGGGS